MAIQSFIQQLDGATVVDIRPMSDDYREASGWSDDSDPGTTIVFSNGAQIHSQGDPEGNRPGHMIFEDQVGDTYHLFKG